MIDVKLPCIEVPEGPEKNKIKDYEIYVFIWKEKSKEALEIQRHAKEGYRIMFALAIEQCYPALSKSLKGTSSYREVEAIQEGIKLLVMIRSIICGVEEHLQDTRDLKKSDKT